MLCKYCAYVLDGVLIGVGSLPPVWRLYARPNYCLVWREMTNHARNVKFVHNFTLIKYCSL